MRCSQPCLSPHEETAYSPSVRGGPQTWELWLWASAAPLITGVCVGACVRARARVQCWSGDRLT